MAQISRQSSLLVQQDWTKVYQAFTNADFTSYDFETLRSTMINYLKTYYPETFNDFLESSEYLALIDMIAFLGQSLSFRTDLNARENFLDTAQRRDSILKLARMLSYNPQRTASSTGLLKFDSIKTTEQIFDSSGINLSNKVVHWNDLTNDNWQEQFTSILNASLVSSQVIGKPGNSATLSGIKTDEYTISLNTNSLPIAAFSAVIKDTATRFEAVSATSVGENYIYEVDPTTVGAFNILYRNDNNGNASNNTGYFVFFKQGTLQATNFTITDAVPNNYVRVATNDINNDDHWLYSVNAANNTVDLWEAVPALAGVNVIYNQIAKKNLYQINTLNGDQVELVFGDGSFSAIPQGSYRFYYRTSNGLSYSITPDDLSSVTIAFSYISKSNAIETLTVTTSLKYTVTNASATQTLDSIKTAAPQQYYTQNRMVTGEDYQIFPQTTFDSIQKIKVTNRSSSGVSSYLDSIDPTGSYSSTNIIGSDGNIAAVSTTSSTTFSFVTNNDIYNAIYNNIIPIVSSPEMINYYYANYPTYNSIYANVEFLQTANSASTSSGYLQYNSTTQQVGPGISGNVKYVDSGASLQFTAPTGYYFNNQHQLVLGTPAGSGNVYSIYASVSSVVANDDIDTPSLVTVGTIVPTGAILSNVALAGADAIIPPYKTDLTNDLIATMVSQISGKVNFGLTYDQVNQKWINIPPSQIGSSTDWLLKFDFGQGLYTISSKILTYEFSSVRDTRFYFDPSARVYNSSTGTNVIDTINILKINVSPTDPNKTILNDSIWQIYNNVVETDGYVDNSKVLVKIPSTQVEYVPDNPKLYKDIASTATSRDSLYFHYKHNVSSRNRIDPTPVNLMDVYIMTVDYATDYINWLRDITGTITEPLAPTSSSLEISYSALNEYKVISDTLIYNPAKFKPLFGSKADPTLQARFQIVKNPAVAITDNEVKSRTITAINKYFDLSNWDFGDTFYFSELAAYLHSQLAPAVSSIVIVPSNNSLVFGNYFQINSEPWEIITSAATVNDIDIVSAVTAAQLNLGNPLIGTF